MWMTGPRSRLRQNPFHSKTLSFPELPARVARGFDMPLVSRAARNIPFDIITLSTKGHLPHFDIAAPLLKETIRKELTTYKTFYIYF